MQMKERLTGLNECGAFDALAPKKRKRLIANSFIAMLVIYRYLQSDRRLRFPEERQLGGEALHETRRFDLLFQSGL